MEIQDKSRLPKDFVIFYCWQDQLDKKLNRFLIRDAINAAIKRVQDEMPDDCDCVLRLDSDTAGRAGSVEIADTILRKINECSMIIGDVTPVISDSEKKVSYPNANVMLELGFGARALGWTRIVCLYNDAFCKPEELPFDIRHRRVTSYRCSDSSKKPAALKDLEGTLVASLRAVLQEIGRGEFDPTLGNAAIKRVRDVALLRQLLGTIHRSTMDYIIERGTAYQLHYDGILFWEGFDAVVSSCHFRFYDKKLEELTRKLHEVWGTAVHIGSNVFYPGVYPGSFVLLPDEQWDKKYEENVEKMGNAFATMSTVLNEFLGHIHSEYPEVNMDETDAAAWKNNLPYMTKVGKKEPDAEASKE